jgi:hypothetical protein
MNNNGDVVYERGTTVIHLWDTRPQHVPIAAVGNSSPGGGTFTRFGERPVVNDAQRVAFEAEVSGGPEGISRRDRSAPIDACALEDAPSPIAGGTYNTFAPTGAVSINAAGKVAFTSNIQQPGPCVQACSSAIRRSRASSPSPRRRSGLGVGSRGSTTSSSASTPPIASPSSRSPPVGAGDRVREPPFTALTHFSSERNGVRPVSPRSAA